MSAGHYPQYLPLPVFDPGKVEAILAAREVLKQKEPDLYDDENEPTGLRLALVAGPAVVDEDDRVICLIDYPGPVRDIENMAAARTDIELIYEGTSRL